MPVGDGNRSDSSEKYHQEEPKPCLQEENGAVTRYSPGDDFIFSK